MSATAIAMPRLGMTMEEGTVVEWPVPVGQRVEKGQTVLVIETEKAESEIEATASGVFRHAFVAPGETVPCGTLLGALTSEAEEDFDPDAFRAGWAPPGGVAAESPVRAPAPAPDAAQAGAARAPAGARRPVAPAARALARQLEIDLERVTGTGPGGRVTKQDVEAAAAARERLVEVEPGVALEVLREGQGDPVVLLPGFGSDVSSFAMLIPALSAEFELIGVHPRGVGASDAPDAELYPVARAARDVAVVLDRVLAGSPPVHVVGASLGAAVALELALAQPERVRSLALITPFLEATPRLLAVADAWARIAAEARPETLAAFLVPWLFGDALLADERRRERTLRGLAQSAARVPAATLARTAAGLRAWSGTRSDALAGLRVPTLVLAAGDDLLVPDAERLAAALPDSRLESWPGYGHALAIDAADPLAACLNAHLRGASEPR